MTDFELPSTYSDEWRQDLDSQSRYLTSTSQRAKEQGIHPERTVNDTEIETVSLFSAEVLDHVIAHEKISEHTRRKLLPQYTLLANIEETFAGKHHESNFKPVTSEVPTKTPSWDRGYGRLFVNVNAPWSAFICGSQGSGKSYTLSCILEASLHKCGLGPLEQPLAGIVFHYDKYTSLAAKQLCEAAYLASENIPVNVIVSPWNKEIMEQAYGDLAASMNSENTNLTVKPLVLKEEQLTIERMMILMAVGESSKGTLYMETIKRVLRSLKMKNQKSEGLNYKEFIRLLGLQEFDSQQERMIALRLSLLEGFLNLSDDSFQGQQHSTSSKKSTERSKQSKKDREKLREMAGNDDWNFAPGSLTIVDLSCPFIGNDLACTLFDIMLGLFLGDREECGRIVVLDEAHKFLTNNDAARSFTESLLEAVKLQRHYATRVVVATQEPTISPDLLELCSFTIVHRFSSAEWFRTLQKYLAALSSRGQDGDRQADKIFNQIVELPAGQALLFSPSAMLSIAHSSCEDGLEGKKLGRGYARIQVRKRVGIDGGGSLMAHSSDL